MSRRSRHRSSHHSSHGYYSDDPIEKIIHNIKQQFPDYAVSKCVFHTRRCCFTLLNTFNSERFHCLFADKTRIWRSYSLTESCDLPDYCYDLILLNRLLGDEYVLPFASQFREYSGFTIAMYRQDTQLYRPNIITRTTFKRMAFAMIVLYVAVCWIMGGCAPDIGQLSFVYTPEHPVLCDIGAVNSAMKQLIDGQDRFYRKKWVKFLNRKKCDKIVRHLKSYYPNYFQKKKPGRRCILKEREGAGFDDLTHSLICQNRNLITALHNFKELTSNQNIQNYLIPMWIRVAQPLN